MKKSARVAISAAATLLSVSFMLAYGATTAANAQVQPFQAPVIVARAVATPVEQVVSDNSAAPIEGAAPEAATPAASLSQLVSDWQDDGDLDAEARCLATAIFFEARSESLDGQLAVANVILARAQSGRFAKTICGVVMQPGQFGFVRKGRMPAAPEGDQWHTAKAIADIALDGGWRNPVEGALYFHATYSGADWDRPRVAQIGRHVFYR